MFLYIRNDNTSNLHSFTTALTLIYLITLLWIIGGYVAFPSNVEVDEETGEISKELDDPDLLQNRPPLQRAIVISGKFRNCFYLALNSFFNVIRIQLFFDLLILSIF